MANWIPFITDLGDGPGSVTIDIDLAASGSDLGRGTMVLASIPLREAGEHGMGEQGEVEAIHGAIDKVADALSASCDAVHALTIRTGGRYDAVFYLPGAKAGEAEMMLGVALSPLDAECVVQPDEAWQLYHELLPEEGDIRRAMDIQRLSELAAAGDDLSVARPVSHQLRLPDRVAVERAKQSLAAAGFMIVGESSDAAEELPFRLVLQRVDVAEPERMLAVSDALAELAMEMDGEYAGWECPPAG